MSSRRQRSAAKGPDEQDKADAGALAARRADRDAPPVIEQGAHSNALNVPKPKRDPHVYSSKRHFIPQELIDRMSGPELRAVAEDRGYDLDAYGAGTRSARITFAQQQAEDGAFGPEDLPEGLKKAQEAPEKAPETPQEGEKAAAEGGEG